MQIGDKVSYKKIPEITGIIIEINNKFPFTIENPYIYIVNDNGEKFNGWKEDWEIIE